MTPEQAKRVKAKIKAKIDEMDDYELAEIAESEESFFDWLGDVLETLGYIIKEVATAAWEWFKSWFD
jgi:hypothetical protein